MAAPLDGADAPLRITPLHDLHVSLGARMVPFAGYAMPVQYPTGIIAEHLHTRTQAGLFDVSHMGQAILAGRDAARRLEQLVPADIIRLREGRSRYTQFLQVDGTILDDLMVTRLADDDDGRERLFLVVNAGTKEADFAHLRRHLPDLALTVLDDRALLALQGPAAAAALARHVAGVADMAFMAMREADLAGVPITVSRSGYTGEDGYEISLPAAAAVEVAGLLLAEPDVKPIGLGARDTLRLEAGLCLYGHDIDRSTTPIEAGLAWSIGARRRLDGGFPGEVRVRREIDGGPARRRVGLRLDGRAPAREGTEIVTPDGKPVGRVTSGGFAPSLEAPVAMGMVETAHAQRGTPLALLVRGKLLSAVVADLPFVPHRYHRGR